MDHLLHSLFVAGKRGYGNLGSAKQFAVAAGCTSNTIGRAATGIQFDLPVLEAHVDQLAANAVLR